MLFLSKRKPAIKLARKSAEKPDQIGLFIAGSLEGERHYRAWLWITLGLSLLPYVIMAPTIWSAWPNIVHDDARHFVVWLRRLTDGDLYPNDVIADYFTAVTPWLYRAVYWPFMRIGLDPTAVHLFITAPASGALFAGVAYCFVFRFWPSPIGAAVASLAMIDTLGLVQGLPRDFGFALALLLILLFVSRRVVWSAVSMFAAAGVLPVVCMTSGLTMALLMVSRRFPFVTRERTAWITLAAAGIAAVAGGYLAVSEAGRTGASFTIAEARSIPFFNPEGRRPYFGASFASTYLCNERAGIVPLCEVATDSEAIIWSLSVAALMMLALWLVGRGHAAALLARAGLSRIDRSLAAIWAALVVSGTALFVFAHWVAFALHLPQRFSQYTITLAFAMMVAIAIAVVTTVLLKSGLRWRNGSLPAAWPAPAALVVAITAWSALSWKMAEDVPLEHGAAPQVYDFLHTTPKPTIVAGFVEGIDSVPALGGRSIWGSLQLLVPYKKPYYQEIERRMTDLARTLYASTPEGFAAYRAQHGIGYVLVSRAVEDDVVALRTWAANFPSISTVIGTLDGGMQPFFRARLGPCERAGNDRLVLLDAACIAEVAGLSLPPS